MVDCTIIIAQRSGVGAIVGTLRYGSPEHRCELDDRTLAHLAVVIFDLLHRGKAFPFTFDTDTGPVTLWLSRSIGLRFDFEYPAPVAINGDWLLALERTAHTDAGLQVVAEPIEAPLTAAPSGPELIGAEHT